LKLKIGALPDDKAVKLVVEIPAGVHRDLLAYAQLLASNGAQPAGSPGKLIIEMVKRFTATDRAFAKCKRAQATEMRTRR
jgi:hypothetical protein